jgi:tellurite resistance protein
VDTFIDEQEIRIRGQRIVYMVHDKVGHLGIFVSSSIARKEHTEMTSTLKTIEALAPGLYEMKIDETAGDEGNEHFFVSFHDRKMQDILTTVQNDREQEKDFAAVARLSELGAHTYDVALRPVLQSLVTQQTADALRDSHPSRVSRKLFSDANPLLPLMSPLSDWARDNRQKTTPDNPFLAVERLMANSVIQAMDLMRDLRDAAYENTFLAIYGTPLMHAVGRVGQEEPEAEASSDLRHMPEVKKALAAMEHGDLGAAVIRMLVLLAGSRGSVRKDRLERSAQVLNSTEPFKSMGAERRAELIQEQSIIAEFEPQRAVETLAVLLKTEEDRLSALDVVNHILGARAEMEPHSLELIQRMESLLGAADNGHSTRVVAKKSTVKKAAKPR